MFTSPSPTHICWYIYGIKVLKQEFYNIIILLNIYITYSQPVPVRVRGRGKNNTTKYIEENKENDFLHFFFKSKYVYNNMSFLPYSVNS